MLILLVFVSAVLFISTQSFIPSGSPTVNVSAARLEPKKGDAMASVSSLGASFNPSAGKTIHIEGRKGSIVGQLAKIPLENGEISDIKTVSKVDNRAGRELLSIISKY